MDKRKFYIAEVGKDDAWYYRRHEFIGHKVESRQVYTKRGNGFISGIFLVEPYSYTTIFLEVKIVSLTDYQRARLVASALKIKAIKE